MSREIKFRAYIKTLKLIVPVSRINFDCETIEVDISSGNGDLVEYDFDEVILMRYTGLKDKNGVEIYGGDVVSHGFGFGNGKGIVFYSPPTFEELRMIFNKILQQSIDKMQENESEDCTMNIKFKIGLKDFYNEDGEIYKSPRFKYDVSSEFKQKLEAGGEIALKNNE